MFFKSFFSRDKTRKVGEKLKVNLICKWVWGEMLAGSVYEHWKVKWNAVWMHSKCDENSPGECLLELLDGTARQVRVSSCTLLMSLNEYKSFSFVVRQRYVHTGQTTQKKKLFWLGKRRAREGKKEKWEIEITVMNPWKFIFHHVCKCLFWNSFKTFPLMRVLGIVEGGESAKEFITLKMWDFLFLLDFPEAFFSKCSSCVCSSRLQEEERTENFQLFWPKFLPFVRFCYRDGEKMIFPMEVLALWMIRSFLQTFL